MTCAAVLPAVDAAVVVCEADEKKVPQLQLILRELEDHNIPHFLFLNKIDKADKRVRETLKLLQPASRVPLLLRQIPIWNGDIISGFVDLALERAHVYKEHAPSEVIELKGEDRRSREGSALHHAGDAGRSRRRADGAVARGHPAAARQGVRRSRQGIARSGWWCPVLLGVATRSNGVLRLLKALRHEAPGVAETVARLGAKAGSDPLALVLKTFHTTHGGKMSIARLLAGQVDRRHHVPYAERRGRTRVRRVQGHGPALRQARAGDGRRDRRLRQARRRQDRRHAVGRQAGACRAGRGETLSAGARARGAGQGAQGRRQARRRLHQADRGGSLAHASCTTPRTTRW